jgi:hypothetical protein
MRNTLLLVFFFISFGAFYQQKEGFAMLIAQQKPFSTKYSFSVDYGEATKVFSDTRMKNDQGAVIKFNSVVDAMNYMTAQGWEYIDRTELYFQNIQTHHYLFKKAVD